MRDAEAGGIVASHFLELGHTRIGHLAGPPELDTVARRRDGFVDRARRSGVDPVVLPAALSEEDGCRAMQALLQVDPTPTAVFIANINQAFGALAAVRERGLSVPADLSLVCHDDDPVFAFLDAPLTAVRMPLHELGLRAVDALIEQIGGAPPRDIEIESAPSLVLRRSTGPAGSMRIRAAVMDRPGAISIENLDARRRRARDEVLVRMLASGICRSDLSLLDGTWPAPLPMVLGHEGAGSHRGGR